MRHLLLISMLVTHMDACVIIIDINQANGLVLCQKQVIISFCTKQLSFGEIWLLSKSRSVRRLLMTYGHDKVICSSPQCQCSHNQPASQERFITGCILYKADHLTILNLEHCQRLEKVLQKYQKMLAKLFNIEIKNKKKLTLIYF